MCHSPTKEETTRSEARRTAVGSSGEKWRRDSEGERRRDPSGYPMPRGNGETEQGEVDRGVEKLAAVLGR